MQVFNPCVFVLIMLTPCVGKHCPCHPDLVLRICCNLIYLVIWSQTIVSPFSVVVCLFLGLNRILWSGGAIKQNPAVLLLSMQHDAAGAKGRLNEQAANSVTHNTPGSNGLSRKGDWISGLRQYTVVKSPHVQLFSLFRCVFITAL